MKRIFFLLSVIVLSANVTFAEIKTEAVNYSQGNVTLKGYLAYDDSIKEKRPAILVVHEWWGHNDYARRRARMLAELGYTALAVDMYGDGQKAEHPDDAGTFASKVSADMQGIGKTRFLAALDLIKNHPSVDPDKTAAIGYCFGGGTVLHMARFGVDLDGVVSFHGSLATDTPALPGAVKAKVLVCHGADDSFIPQEHINNFKAEMDSAGVNYQFKSYEGAVHSFTNPDADKLAEKFGMPIAYHEKADKQSWQDMTDFLKAIF